MTDRPFNRQSILTDLGELDHVIYLFSEYQNYPDSLSIDNGPWPRLVETLQGYLQWAGVRDAHKLTASDLLHKVEFQDRTDIVAAMECLSLLLAYAHPHDWGAEAVDDLRIRLTNFYAILLEADVHRMVPLAVAGKKHGEAQRAKARKRRPRVKTDDAAISMEEIVRDVCRFQDEDLTAAELWPHLHARLETLHLDPVESDDVIEYRGGKISLGRFKNLVTKVRRQRN